MVADIHGAEEHMLVFDGPPELLRETLRDSELEIRIDPHGTRKEWYELYEPRRAEEQARLAEQAALAAPAELFATPPPFDPSSSMLGSLRRVRGKGSVYEIGFLMYISAGASFYWWLPPVCTCMGVAAPAAVLAGGDVDLFLSLNFTPAPVAVSARRGTASEVVTYSVTCWPWANFIPFFTVTAFTTAVAPMTFAGATFFP
jgi:hypothetical protein